MFLGRLGGLYFRIFTDTVYYGFRHHPTGTDTAGQYINLYALLQDNTAAAV